MQQKNTPRNPSFFLKKDFTYALVGASADKKKFGAIVFDDLLQSGYHILPVNPHRDMIMGQPVYPSLHAIDEKIDVVIFVVPPVVTNRVLEDVSGCAITRVWFQPGSYDQESIRYCDHHHISYYARSCIMQERKKLSS